MTLLENRFKNKAISFVFTFLVLTACSPSLTPIPNVDAHPQISTATPTLSAWEVQECNQESRNSIIDYNWIWKYTGVIDGFGKIDIILNNTENNKILGFAFDTGQIIEYQIEGCIDGRNFIMWLKQGGSVGAIIKGEFPLTDPRGFYPSSKELSFDVITGSFIKKYPPQESPIYLRLLSGVNGTMEHRFQIAGIKDDKLILDASRQFLASIVSNERTQVVEMIRFPVKYSADGVTIEIETPEAFLAQYDTIFENNFKERLAITFPNYLMPNTGNFIGTISQSIYGGGGITFDKDGKVIAISNWIESVATPTILETP